MEGYPGGGALLARLADYCGLDAGALSALTGVEEPELRAAFDGVPPDPMLVRRLAPVLGLHAADLFVVAGVEVPEDLAPLDPRAAKCIERLVRQALQLPSQSRRRLCALVRSLPQEDRTQPVPPLHGYEQYPPGPGGVLVRMLRNRNLDWNGTARVFYHLTGRYWSASTYAMVGAGRKALTADLVVDFATVLGLPPARLSALTGLALPIGERHPAAADAAELIWGVRRLTADQVQQVSLRAESMPRE